MDVTVYLPDAVGKAAKEEGINLSGTLRDALETELDRRKRMRSDTTEAQVYELNLTDNDGGQITGRVTGRFLEETPRGYQTYLTDDERVVLYEPDHERAHAYDDADAAVAELDPAEFVGTFHALGYKPVIDL